MSGRAWRSFVFGLAVSLEAAAGRGQEAPQYFEEPAAKPHLALQWDAIAAYDHIDHLPYHPSITRGRFEVRPQVDFLASSNFQLGLRVSLNYGTEPNVDNALYEDNWISRAAYLDRYFLKWAPGAWTFQAGAFALPVVASPMLWDRYNIQTPGAVLSYVDRLGLASTLTFSAAGFYSPQHYRDESIIGVGQIVWDCGEPSRLAVQAAASFWNYDMRDVDPQYFRQNRVRLVDGRLDYASKFELADLLVRFEFPVARLPVAVNLDFIHNFGIVGRGPNAYEAGLTVGTVGTPGTARAFFAYQYIGRDALVGAYNTDEWWWHTWAEGYRFGVAYTILPQVYAQTAIVLQRRLDYDSWINRVTVSLVKMF